MEGPIDWINNCSYVTVSINCIRREKSRFFISMADSTVIPDQRCEMRKKDVPMWIFKPLH